MTRRKQWRPLDQCCIDIRLAAWGDVPGQLALVPVDVPGDSQSITSTGGAPALFDPNYQEEQS